MILVAHTQTQIKTKPHKTIVQIGTYDETSSDNVYSRTVGTNQVYLMFNYKAFAWVCTNTNETSSCYSYYDRATTPEWYDLSDKDKDYVTFNWTTQTANITCIGNSSGQSSSLSPSQVPSSTPAVLDFTTYNPTNSPSAVVVCDMSSVFDTVLMVFAFVTPCLYFNFLICS